MFTIIVCSIRPQEAEKLKKNIEATIGVPFEFIAYDNRDTGKGICQVYNECAERAQYDYLCFAHEDIEFLTDNWGEKIASKLKDKDCGVIGFAGSAMKSKHPGGWCSTSSYGQRMNMIQVEKKNKERKYKVNPYNEDFSRVITADGLCLFASRQTWASVKFDETVLTGFHCYDVDFAIGVHVAGYKNYICHNVMVKHFSSGNYDKRWWVENEKMHKKWAKTLPLYVNEKKSHLYRMYLEYKSSIAWTYVLGKSGVFDGIKKRHILAYVTTHPLNGRSYKLLANYLKYRRSHKNNDK